MSKSRGFEGIVASFAAFSALVSGCAATPRDTDGSSPELSPTITLTEPKTSPQPQGPEPTAQATPRPTKSAPTFVNIEGFDISFRYEELSPSTAQIIGRFATTDGIERTADISLDCHGTKATVGLETFNNGLSVKKNEPQRYSVLFDYMCDDNGEVATNVKEYPNLSGVAVIGIDKTANGYEDAKELFGF